MAECPECRAKTQAERSMTVVCSARIFEDLRCVVDWADPEFTTLNRAYNSGLVENKTLN
jgi:hypothetical protein